MQPVEGAAGMAFDAGEESAALHNGAMQLEADITEELRTIVPIRGRMETSQRLHQKKKKL